MGHTKGVGSKVSIVPLNCSPVDLGGCRKPKPKEQGQERDLRGGSTSQEEIEEP